MIPTRALLPAVPVLTVLTVATACGSPVAGEWEAVELTRDGTTYPTPIVYTFRLGAYDYEVGMDMVLFLDGHGDGVARRDLSVTKNGNLDEVASGTTFPEVTGTKTDDGWDLSIATEAPLDLACTRDGAALTCEGDADGTPVTIDWERVD